MFLRDISQNQHLKINVDDHFNRLNEKNDVIISRDTEKTFHKIQQPITIKALYKL